MFGENLSFSSESSSASGGSHEQMILMFQKDKEELSPHGSPAHRINRTGTVRRTGGRLSLPGKNFDDLNQCVPEYNISSMGSGRRERYRRSLDATYRRSLDSISEYKPKRSFSSSLVPSSSKEYSSIDSSSSDYTDYNQHRSSTAESTKDTTITSTGSSNYTNWLENVSQEWMENSTSGLDNLDFGEWNSFWLQYTNPQSKLQNYFAISNEEKIPDEENSDLTRVKNSEKGQNTREHLQGKVILSIEEITQAIQCCQKVSDILQNALNRKELLVNGDLEILTEENNMFMNVEKSKESPHKTISKNRQVAKKPIYSSNSYLNALFTTGVADILKKMLSKRRSFTSDDSPILTRSRSSCSE